MLLNVVAGKNGSTTSAIASLVVVVVGDVGLWCLLAGERMALDMCHAIGMVKTVVLPLPVAISMPIRNSSGLALHLPRFGDRGYQLGEATARNGINDGIPSPAARVFADLSNKTLAQ